MRRIAEASDRRTWSRRLRRATLLALLAVAAATLLPLAHAASGHLGDCGVCSVLTHAGSSTADLVTAQDPPHPALVPELAPSESARALPPRSLSAPCARAPPSLSVPS